MMDRNTKTQLFKYVFFWIAMGVSPGVNAGQLNGKFFVKDESMYSKSFLDKFKAKHGVYESVSLIDDSIIINNDRPGSVLIPTDLPLNRQVVYQTTENKKKQVLIVKRINCSTLEYSYFEENNGKKMNQKQGAADLEPVFYSGAEGAFEDENENVYGMNEYVDDSEKGCWAKIYVGVGSIEKSQLIYGCETGRVVFNSKLLRRTK